MKDKIELRRRRLAKLKKYSDRDASFSTILLARRFLHSYPDTSFVWFWLGTSLMKVGQVNEAEEALLKVLELESPNAAWATLGFLGRNCRDAGEFDRAEAWFRRLIDEFPTRADGCIYLGTLLGRRGRLDQAEAVLRKGTLCVEGYIDEAWMLLGNVLAAQHKFADAANCYREALAIDPNYRLAKSGLRDVLVCLELDRRKRR